LTFAAKLTTWPPIDARLASVKRRYPQAIRPGARFELCTTSHFTRAVF
jgi:hypothetical protein